MPSGMGWQRIIRADVPWSSAVPEMPSDGLSERRFGRMPVASPPETCRTSIMTEKPAPLPPAEMFVPIQNLPSAPIIFFEFCPTLGNNNGLINIMLGAGLVMPTSGPGTETIPVAVAHLRCTTTAATQLRDALNKALELGAAFEPPQGRAN
jgi:hypothetical protein